MVKRTAISLGILLIFICLLLGFSVGSPELWTKYLSHWVISPSIAHIMTLLIGLVLMDDIFELDDLIVIILKKSKLKIEIKKYLVGAFLIVCIGSIIFEVVQIFISQAVTSLIDPLTAIAGSVFGIVLHIIGSSYLMKRVEFELERWEDNVL